MRSSQKHRKTWTVLTALIGALCLLQMPAQAQSYAFQDSWRWAHFTTEAGLPSDQVFCIAETPDRTIWAGTEKGLAWFDGYGWHALDSLAGIPAEKVSVIEPYGRDSVFCVVQSALYLGGRTGLTRINCEDSIQTSIQSVVFTKRNQILVLSNASLCLLEKNRLIPIKTPSPPLSGGPRNLWQTASGSIWLSTIRGLYHGDGKVWKLVASSEEVPAVVLNVVEDRKGNGAAAFTKPRERHGIYEWSRGGRAHLSGTERSGGQLAMDGTPDGDVLVTYEYGEIRLRHHGAWSSIVPRPLQFNSAHALKFGKDRALWVGTEYGLFRFQTLSSRWTYWSQPFGDPRNGIHEITRTSDGSIWLGTFNGLEIHRPNGRVENIERILGTKLGTITCIAEDRQHNVWIGSGAEFPGAFQWNGKSWKHFGNGEGLKADRVHKIRRDRNGDLWFLGLGIDGNDPSSGPGAFQYKNGKFIPWSKRDGLLNGRVYAFAEGPDGSRWFGTYLGISRWKDGAWRHWNSTTGLVDKTTRIYALAIDSSGTVWFANCQNGLGTVSRDGSIHFLTTADGLVNDEIWDLMADESGVLWIATLRGLACYNNGVFSRFTIRSGLSSPVLWEVLPLKDRVYIGSPGAGVNILDRAEKVDPPKITLNPPSFIGSTAILAVKVTPYFSDLDPRDVEIRHRVDGGDWSKWSSAREIELKDLNGGEHSLQVQAKGLFGDFDSAGALKSFEVEPGLLQRPSVLISLILLAGSFSILGGAYLRRKRTYQRVLRKSDERFHLVSATTADVIYDWDFSSGELWVNDPQQSLTTGPQPDVNNALETWMRNVHPEDRAHLKKEMSDAASVHSSDWQSEYRSLKTDGTYGHMLHRGHFEFDDSGKPIRALGSIMDITGRKEAEALSRSISKRIIEAQESERRRVSRELHDSVNQILASVKFRIESLEEQLPRKDRQARQEARKTKVLLNKVMTEIRRISRNLRPAELDDLGLGSAVRSLADEFAERTQITTVVKDEWPKKPLSPEVRLTLYRIIQESLTNVEKHAGAKRVKIGCMETEAEIVCTIEDNGHGIRTDEQTKARARGDGLGLLDMQERLSFIGGTLEISSVPRRGTTVTIHIPSQHLPVTNHEKA
jgi:signal transduction histidine kinase/ligand-binding sensor domain-containing protein